MPGGIIRPLEGLVNGPMVQVRFLGEVVDGREIVRSLLGARTLEYLRRVKGRFCLVCGEHCPHGTAGHHVNRVVLCRPCRRAGWLLRAHPDNLSFAHAICPQCDARLFPHIGICPKCLFPEVSHE